MISLTSSTFYSIIPRRRQPRITNRQSPQGCPLRRQFLSQGRAPSMIIIITEVASVCLNLSYWDIGINPGQNESASHQICSYISNYVNLFLYPNLFSQLTPDSSCLSCWMRVARIARIVTCETACLLANFPQLSHCLSNFLTEGLQSATVRGWKGGNNKGGIPTPPPLFELKLS